jgi:cardiolipin synthase
VLTWMGLVPRYLAVAAVGRDVLIVAGSAAYAIGWGPLRGRPILSSKINTVLQLLYVLLVVTHAGWGQPPATVLQALAVATFATVTYSGVAYLWEFTHRALQPAAPSG